MSDPLPTGGTAAEALQFLARGPHALAEAGYSPEAIVSASIHLAAGLTPMMSGDMDERLFLAASSIKRGQQPLAAFAEAFRALGRLYKVTMGAEG